jgi:hypothetical protein
MHGHSLCESEPSRLGRTVRWKRCTRPQDTGVRWHCIDDPIGIAARNGGAQTVSHRRTRVESVIDQQGVRAAEQRQRCLERRIAGVCGHLNAQHGSLIDLAVEVLATDAWHGWGFRSPEHWMSLQTGMSSTRSHSLVLLARRADELPVTIEAVRSGRLSIDQAVVVARCVPACNDREACDLALQCSVSQLRRPSVATPSTRPIPAPSPTPLASPKPKPKPMLRRRLKLKLKYRPSPRLLVRGRRPIRIRPWPTADCRSSSTSTGDFSCGWMLRSRMG